MVGGHRHTQQKLGYTYHACIFICKLNYQQSPALKANPTDTVKATASTVVNKRTERIIQQHDRQSTQQNQLTTVHLRCVFPQVVLTSEHRTTVRAAVRLPIGVRRHVS